MDIEQLLQDFGIHYQTEGHKHCRPGWVNIPCPFCTGNPGLHLGITKDGSTAYCWRCNWKPLPKAIATLLKVNEEQAKEIIRQYGGKPKTRKTTQLKVGKKPFKLPSETGPLQERHKKYLRRRRFDPDYLEQEWDLMATGPTSKLNGIDYKHRILIPIYWNGEIVSFQTRDITGKSNIKYKACPKEREKVNHQEVFYAHPKNQPGTTAICVEGVTDVWRFGSQSIATFGIEFTRKQLQILAKSLQQMAVVFDDDPQAVVQANRLVSELRFRGVKAWQVTIAGDPGDMSNKKAREFVKQIINK